VLPGRPIIKGEGCESIAGTKAGSGQDAVFVGQVFNFTDTIFVGGDQRLGLGHRIGDNAVASILVGAVTGQVFNLDRLTEGILSRHVERKMLICEPAVG
jgi:hypothetical protein